MKPELLSATESAAMGAKLSRIELAPNYPTAFANDIINKISQIHDCNVMDVESENSAISAAMGSELSGKRTFLAASKPFPLQEIYQSSFMRLPLVMANISKTLGTGIRNDHNGVLALRDMGWLIFMPETNQEILDSIIQAYRICEDNRVLLPAVINVDSIPNLREPVLVPSEQSVDKFLPKLKLPHSLDIKNPVPFGAVINDKIEFIAQQQKAMENSLKLMEKIEEQWKTKFRRSYGLIEKYFMEDAEYVIVTAGSNSSTARSAVKKLREDGEKVGLLRIRIARPFPKNEIENALENAKKVAVVDQDISLGYNGILYTEIARNDYSNFICPGRFLNNTDFINIIKRLKGSEKPERVWML